LWAGDIFRKKKKEKKREKAKSNKKKEKQEKFYGVVILSVSRKKPFKRGKN
jgi:hypothetical protein